MHVHNVHNVNRHDLQQTRSIQEVQATAEPAMSWLHHMHWNGLCGHTSCCGRITCKKLVLLQYIQHNLVLSAASSLASVSFWVIDAGCAGFVLGPFVGGHLTPMQCGIFSVSGLGVCVLWVVVALPETLTPAQKLVVSHSLSHAQPRSGHDAVVSCTLS